MSGEGGRRKGKPHGDAVKVGGYRGLALAICVMAAKDYAREFHGYLKTEPYAREPTKMMREIERFFSSKDFIIYSDALEPSEMLKRAKLRGAELFYQDYICMLADIRRTGKCNDERMKKRFEYYIFSEEFRQTAYRVLSITPQEIIRNAEKFVEENLDKIRHRKYSAVRFLRLDGRKPSDSDGEM